MGFQSIGRLMAPSSTVSPGTTNTLSSFAASNRSRRARQSDAVAFHPSQKLREPSGTAISPVRATRDNRHVPECRPPLWLRPTCGSISDYSRQAQLGSTSLVLRRLWSLGTRELRGGARTATAQTALSVEVLSSRPELVTGGDALGADTHRR
jgi:hypothetical protein